MFVFISVANLVSPFYPLSLYSVLSQSGLYSQTFTITTKSTHSSWPHAPQKLQNSSLPAPVQIPAPPACTEELPLLPLCKATLASPPPPPPPTPTASLLSQTFSCLSKNLPFCEIIRFVAPDPKHVCIPPARPPPLDPSQILHLSSSETSGSEGTIILLTENRAFVFFSCQQDLLSLRKENLVSLCDFIELRLEATELFALLSHNSPLCSPQGHDEVLHSMRTLRLLGFELVSPRSRAWPSDSLSPDEYSCLVYSL